MDTPPRHSPGALCFVGSAVRPGSPLGHAGKPARAPALVAALCGGRAPTAADRHSSGLYLSSLAHVAGVADLLHRGLRWLRPGVPVAARQPDCGRRVCEVSRSQGRADRIRGHLAAGLSVAVLKILARRTLRGAGSIGRRPRSCATTSASPSSRSIAQPSPTSSSARSTIWVPMLYCFMRRTFRIGSSTTTRRCRRRPRRGVTTRANRTSA
jgi:hypothetical protein